MSSDFGDYDDDDDDKDDDEDEDDDILVIVWYKTFVVRKEVYFIKILPRAISDTITSYKS